MYKGFVLSESLNHPPLLNNYDKIDVIVEEHPENAELPIWHDFKLKIQDGDIKDVSETISTQLKYGWYAHFWNGKEVIVCFPTRVFTIPQETEWKSKEYQKLKEYALNNGVEEQYLDFYIEE